LQSFSTLCHAKGIIFCLDAIQSLGAIPMDVTKLGVDFLSAGAYKWMMAPIGTGFLYLTDEMQEMLEVAGLGYMGTQNPEEYKDLDQPLHADARRFEVGAFPTPGVAGARAALDLILNCGIENVQLHIDNLIHRFKTGLEFTEFLPLYSFSKEERSGIFMFTHKDMEKNSEICDNLDARNVNIALRDGVLRFSPHYHNSAEQVDKFLEMLSDFR
jgi:selenocysteine lyase/cysteine desulfurase